MALPADHKNFGSIGSIGERAGYAGDIYVKPIVTKKFFERVTFRDRAPGTKVLPSCAASAGRPKAAGREVRAFRVRGQAFRRG